MNPNPFRRPLAGVLMALIYAAIVGGGVLLAQAETPPQIEPTAMPSEWVATAFPIPSLPAESPTGQIPPSTTPAAGRTGTAQPLPSPTCLAPIGWRPYQVGSKDTLAGLAASSQVSVEQIVRQNCLSGAPLVPGQTLYLPAPTQPPTIVTSTPTRAVAANGCPIPAGWVPYTIKRNDGLIMISLAFKVQLNDFLAANCLQLSSVPHPGDIVYVPDLPAPTPTPAPTRRDVEPISP